MRFFVKIRIRIFEPRSIRSWCIKGTDESLHKVDSSVPLIHHVPSDLGSKIRIRIVPKKHTLSLLACSQIGISAKSLFIWIVNLLDRLSLE